MSDVPIQQAGVPDYDVHCTYHGKTFRTLARVCEKSIRANCLEAVTHFKEVDSPRGIRGLPENASANLHKMAYWHKIVQQADRPLVLIDADTVVVNDISEVWSYNFDWAYSIRPHRCPIIGGVHFVRPTEASKRFATQWFAEATTVALGQNACEVMTKWGGLLQSGLNRLRDVGGMDIHELDAAMWNCCDQVWHEFDPDATKVIHLKGRLRREVLKGRSRPSGPNGDLAPLVDEYLKYLKA